jgi:DNA polymerase III alpha subunit (gram-positive type)
MFSWLSKKEKTIYYDFETTGLNQYHDKIIEYAFITEKDGNRDKDIFTNLVNPETKLDNKIISITKITDDMLINKSPIWQQVPKLIKFIESDYGTKYLIAHNNDGFDKIILYNTLKKYDYDCKNYNWLFIDTLLLAKKLLPNIKSYSLKNLCEHFSIKVSGAHRALEDTKMVRKLYHALCIQLAPKINTSYEDLIENPSKVYNYLYI